ncbi:SusC/RagA family TonB-linked outer membrane protein [Ekhidna sp.]
MKKLYRWWIQTVLLLSISTAFAQSKIIEGAVTATDGEPLLGVTILVKGTAIGTTSDIDGNYRVSVPDSMDILVYSYTGFETQEFNISNQTFINVELREDIAALSEVVVVGYSERDSRKLTSSIATVKGSKIEQVPMATFDNILQGAAPGLLVQSGTGQPGRAAEVTIRGIKSINSSSAPLYIIDGLPITSGDFAAINPNDIESVSILKDAAATAIYGSRGASGVIVITTKSGEKGRAKIQYSAQFGISPKPEYNAGLRPLTSAQLIDLQHEIGIGATVGLPQEQLDSLKNINTDWLDVTTQDAITQSHEISVSGGNDQTRFYISGAYFSQEGTSIRSKLDRYSLRTKVDHSVGNFSIGSNLYLGYTDTQDSESEGTFGRSNPFYTSIRGNPYDYAFNPITGDFALPLDIGASSTYNILERIRTNDEDRTIEKINASLKLKYDMPFLEGLSVSTFWGADYSRRDNIDFIDPNSFSATLRDPGDQLAQGRLSQSFAKRARFTGTSSIQYDFDITEDHTFNVALYHEYVYFNGQSTNLEVFGFDQIETIAGATEGTDSNSFIPEFGGGKSETALLSYFGTLDYSYLGRYNFTAGIRRDGSSDFGANNRYGNFYSTGIGWIISEERFMSSARFINFAKLRSSFGTVGKRITGNSARAIYFGTQYNGQNGLASNFANPDLKWEETEKFNIGFDLIVFDNFLTLNVDWYNEETRNLLINAPLSRTTGFSSQSRNNGSIRNRGIEVSLSTNNIRSKNFQWTTNFNIARNRGVVLELPGGESFKLGDFLYEEGKEIRVFNLVRRAGINPANGTTLWYDRNGNLTDVYDEADAVNIARNSPDFFGGLTNTFSYKGLELRVFLTYAQGQHIFNTARTSLDNPTKISRGSVSTNALRFWREPGDITDLPDPSKETTYRFDSGWLEDASFVRLRNVVLSYNLPSSITEKLNITNFRMFIQGQNLYTLTTFSGLDPENSSSDYRADYPALTTYTVGFDVKF